MATTAMNTYTEHIMVHETPMCRLSVRENGGAIFPGFVVTMQGETFPDVAKPDALGDSVAGVALNNPDQDVGTVMSNNDEFDIALLGSGAIVYCYMKAEGGGCVVGELLASDGAGDAGYVTPFKKISAHSTSGSYVSMIVGRAMETLASTASVTPIKVRLAI